MATLRHGQSSANANTSSHVLNLSVAPTGLFPLFMCWAGEDATTTVTSITQTGASWVRLYRDTTHGDGIELWATPAGPTSTSITVNMSGSTWSSVQSLEVAGAHPEIITQRTYAFSSSPTVIQSPTSGAGIIIARRAGAGGSAYQFSPSQYPYHYTQQVVGSNNQTVGFAPLLNPSYSVTGPTTADVGVSIAVLATP